MLLADRVRDYAAGVLGTTKFEPAFRALEQQTRADMPDAKIERRADLRYRGQSYELTVPWQGAERNFANSHERIYGYRMDTPVEVVTVRVRARILTRTVPRTQDNEPLASEQTRRIWISGKWRDVPVKGRSKGRGPALIVDYGSTVLVAPEWSFHTDPRGTLVIRHK
jgi:N-methylhydantoinase A